MKSTVFRPTPAQQAFLERKLAELKGHIPIREELKIETQADPADQVNSIIDRELAVSLLEGQSQLLRDVRIALGKIRSQDYGRCDECHKRIAPKRLDAIPWARYCAPCQDALESRVKQPEFPAWNTAA